MRLFTIFVTAASQAHAWGSTKATPVETQNAMVAGSPSKYNGIIFPSDPSAIPPVKQGFFDFLDGQDASSDLLSIDYHFNKGAAYGIRADKHSVVRVEENKKETDAYISMSEEVEIRDLVVAENGTVFFAAFSTTQAKSYIYKRAGGGKGDENEIYKEVPGVIWSIALTKGEDSFLAIKTNHVSQGRTKVMAEILQLTKSSKPTSVVSKLLRNYKGASLKVRVSTDGIIVSHWGVSNSLEIVNFPKKDYATIKASFKIKDFALFKNEAYVAGPCSSAGQTKLCFEKKSLVDLFQTTLKH